MKTGDITLVFKELLSLNLNHGLVMDANEQSIAIVKRQDQRGIYYSINDTINGKPQNLEHNECAMTILLLNQNRFKNNTTYKSRISLFK
jgi:hypothetical protein